MRDIFEEVRRIIKGDSEKETKFARTVKRLNKMEEDIISSFVKECMEKDHIPTEKEMCLFKAGINYTLGELPRILSIMLLDEDPTEE